MTRNRRDGKANRGYRGGGEGARALGWGCGGPLGGWGGKRCVIEAGGKSGQTPHPLHVLLGTELGTH